MINNLLRGFIYFVVFVLIQVLILNNIHFLRIATPFLYLYFIIKMPVGSSRTQVVFFSFIAGVVIDTFSNTPGMHAAACTFAPYAGARLYIGGILQGAVNPCIHGERFAGRYLPVL